jgi:catechol 2,3-dioxygenase-like lactoylglutathione lyase family enzyme
MSATRKARAVGVNHVALEVGDIEEALAFYGRLFDLKLRGKSATSAFIDMGDQFLALQKGRTQAAHEAAISDLWSMIRMLSVKRYPKPV